VTKQQGNTPDSWMRISDARKYHRNDHYQLFVELLISTLNDDADDEQCCPASTPIILWNDIK
jgi:hypothetical protein